MTEDALFAVLSPDSQVVAALTSTGHRISVFRLADGEQLWHGYGLIPAIAFDRKGRRLAYVSYEGGRNAVDVRDAETGVKLSELCGHDHGIVGLTFSSGGLLYGILYLFVNIRCSRGCA